MKQLFFLFALLAFEKLHAQNSDLPLGSITAYAGKKDILNKNSVWMICDGRSVKINDYLELFKTIGWTYGYGTDTVNRTTFSLPDYRGLFLRGVDDNSGNDPDAKKRKVAFNRKVPIGDTVGSFQNDAVQIHKHNDKGHTHPTNAATATGIRSDNANDRDVGSPPGSASVLTGHADLTEPVDLNGKQDLINVSTETRPINISVYWLIKVK